MFPVALGLCTAVGVPIAVQSRGGGWWMAPLVVAICVAVFGLALMLLLDGSFERYGLRIGGSGEAGAFSTAFTLFYVLPLALVAALVFMLMAAPFGLLAWIAAGFVLRLSREREAFVDGVSILDLPGAGLHFGMLLFVTAMPPAVYLLALLT
ncbi:MAG TPA: hypothetical protein VKY24_16650 [Reyranella sp.]|nr:hypothetical protein [Reyranella sp.]